MNSFENRACRLENGKIDAVVVREARFDDYDRIAALHARHGTVPRVSAQWTRQWKSNPSFRGLGNGMPIGWVLETDRGEVVGSIANVPYAYRFHGRMLCVAAAADWFVDSAYRSYSLRLMAVLMNQQHADIVLTTTASEKTEPIYKTFGWRRVPVGAWDQSAFWVADYRGFANVALRAKSTPFPALLGYPAALALRSWARFKSVGGACNKSIARIEPCAGFDSRFDAFWGELMSQNENVFLAVRDRETLAWHFGHLTVNQSLWIVAASVGSRIVAYAVFDRKDNAAHALTRVRLVDFQALNGYKELLEPLVAWMLNECRRHGIHILENIGCWVERPDLPRVPVPHRRILPAWGFYFKANDTALAAALQQSSVWVPSNFDGDVSI